MQRTEWPEDYDPDARSRPGSRRNSTSHSRRGSVKKEREGKKKSPLNTAPSSSHSTPKKQVKAAPLDFCVTGKKLLKQSDRANSLPGYRRPSLESIKKRERDSAKRTPDRKERDGESPKRPPVSAQSSNSRETSLEDDMSLDLSQVSDFEDTNSKYGVHRKFSALATSTPKPPAPRGLPRGRSASVQPNTQPLKKEIPRRPVKTDSRQSNSTFCSRDESLYRTSTTTNSSYRQGMSSELDYSSVSPEYSGQSSAELSPRVARDADVTASPRSQELAASSCCVSTWQDCSDTETKVFEKPRPRADGEWPHFWANYNSSMASIPVKRYYDQCPTPYRTENIDLADLDFSADGSRKRSPDNMRNLNHIIRDEGLHLTPRETQNIIKCAHILGNVLTKAIERRSKEKDLKEEEKVQEIVEVTPEQDEKELKKKSMTLDLKETAIPLEVKEEKRSETVTTQTDISLPNTKSAPKIFEKILRQLSKSSFDETIERKLQEKIEKELKIEKEEENQKEQSEKKDETMEKIEPSETNNKDEINKIPT